MVPLPEVDDLQAQIAQLTGQVQNEQAQRQQADHARAMAVQQEQHTQLLFNNEQTARNILQTQVNTLNASLATAQGERDTARAQADGLRTRLDNMRGELDEARDGLDRSSQMIARMQEALLELESKTDPSVVSPRSKRTLARIRQISQDSGSSDGSEE
jgi:predicted  nucleic acid-binding Zn-ribbon protein